MSDINATEAGMHPKRNATSFKKGVSANPGGKPVNARNTLQVAFLKDIVAKWEERGTEALDALIDEKPDKFCELVAGLLPQKTEIDVNHGATPELQRVSDTIRW